MIQRGITTAAQNPKTLVTYVDRPKLAWRLLDYM